MSRTSRAILRAIERAIVGSVALVATPVLAQPVRFRYPLEGCAVGCASVTAYFDRDPSPLLRDWNCSSRTYEGHLGTDFAPFGGFVAQDRGVRVVAAAGGVVVDLHDGEPDRCTSGACGGGGGLGNYVVLRHRDGVSSVYGHLRRGSILVRVGQRVSCAAPLASVGSSGNSSGPHLHFEARRDELAVDSFEARASCGAGESLWVFQGPYRALPSEACATDDPADTDAALSADASLSDGSRDAAVSAVPRDGGAMSGVGPGCACRASIPVLGAGSVTIRLNLGALAALALLARAQRNRARRARGAPDARRAHSGASAQQRNPVE
jgi:murein DD-endopeptidase MepM/ murein hydrolase activator NlpD